MLSKNHPTYLGSSVLDTELPDGNLVNYYPIFINERVNVIDLGCGTGRNLIPLASHGLNGIGIDISEDAIIKIKTNAKSLPGSISTFREDIINTNFHQHLSNKVSLVIAANIFNFFTKSTANRLISDIVSKLEKDSYFYITMLTRDGPGLSSIVKECLEMDDGSYFHAKKKINIQFFSMEDLTEHMKDFKLYEITNGNALDLSHGKPHYHRYISYLAKKL